MGELITAMFSSFTEVINGLAGGLSSAFPDFRCVWLLCQCVHSRIGHGRAYDGCHASYTFRINKKLRQNKTSVGEWWNRRLGKMQS